MFAMEVGGSAAFAIGEPYVGELLNIIVPVNEWDRWMVNPKHSISELVLPCLDIDEANC